MINYKADDIIEISNGDEVYVKLPMHFVHDDQVGVFDKLDDTLVTVGEIIKGLDTLFLKGQYNVTKTLLSDRGFNFVSGKTHFHHIHCRKIDTPIHIRIQIPIYESELLK